MDEKTLWSERASMRDFYVNPAHWLFTILTLGIYWVAVWLVRVNTRYKLTNQRLVIQKGILSRRMDEIELFRVTDIKSYQSFLDRLVGVGIIEVRTTDDTGPVVIDKVRQPLRKHEEMRKYVVEARKVAGVRTIVE